MNTPVPISQQAQRGRAVSVVEQFRQDLGRMAEQFRAALPAHIPVERFSRVVMTAIQNNPKLLNCSRQSLFNACMRAAADGLLPDGREGAIVPFGENEDGTRKSSDTASWMPMIAGIRKKVRNSGEIADLWADVVHDGDHYVYRRGDDPLIEHTPTPGSRKRKIIAAYSICRFKDGTVSREWMWVEEIEDIRIAYSRSRKGPWSDPVAYPEMCKKTVVRQHSKQLPMSTDLDDLVRRDDELYEFKNAKARAERALPAGRGAMAALEHFAGNQESGAGTSNGEDVRDGSSSADDSRHPTPDDPQPGGEEVIDGETGEVLSATKATPETFVELLEKAKAHPPKTLDAFRGLMVLLVDEAREIGGEQGPKLLAGFWGGALARQLRNGAQMTKEDADAIAVEMVRPAVEGK